MLIKSIYLFIYWFLLAIYYFGVTKKKPLLHTHLFQLNRYLLKLLTVYSCTPISTSRNAPTDLRPHHKIISWLRTLDPEV